MPDLDPWATLTRPHHRMTRREQAQHEAAFLVDPEPRYVTPADLDLIADREFAARQDGAWR